MLVKATCLYRDRYPKETPVIPTMGNVHVLGKPELQVVIEETERRLQLDIVVEQANFLTGLECRQADVRASITSKGISQGTVTTTANLALHSKVDLGQIVSIQLHRLEGTVCGFALGFVLGVDLLLESTCAILACTSSLAVGLACFRNVDRTLAVFFAEESVGVDGGSLEQFFL